MNQAKDLTKEAPVSPRERIAGFALLPRTIDKCRATIIGKNGEYHYNCPFDKRMLAWKDVNADELKAYVAEGHTNDEIASWFKTHGSPKTDAEIKAWSDDLMIYDMSENKDKAAWLQGENEKLGIPKKASLVDMLEADDKKVFGK